MCSDQSQEIGTEDWVADGGGVVDTFEEVTAGVLTGLLEADWDATALHGDCKIQLTKFCFSQKKCNMKSDNIASFMVFQKQ